MSVNQISSQGVWLTCPLNRVLPPFTGNVGDVNILSLNGDFTFIPRNNFFGRIFTGTLTQNRTYAYPDQSGTIALVGGSGVGTVTNVSITPFAPLFNATVANPTTTPTISFSAISQAQNLFYASPNGAAGNPVFRAIAATDIVPVNAAGFLNNDGLGNLSWQTIGGTISGLTTGFIPVATSSTSIGNSIMSQSGSIVSLPGGLRMTDQSAPSAPASGSIIMQSFNQQGFSVPHIYDTQGNAIEITRDSITVTRNTSGVTINKGQAVYVTGSNGTVPTVALAQANSSSTMPAIGIMYETTNNNNFGRIILIGNLENINLSAFSNGDELYVSSTVAGGLTKTRPTTYPQFVGTVLNNGVGNGVLNISPDGNYPLLYGDNAGGDLTGTYPNPTIGTNKVTYAKMQQASTVTLLGNPTGGTANISEITLGSGLSFSGTTLVATGTGGTVTSFSAGNLSPLFTTSVATATTTPALSFSLTNAGANTYFGNATGLSGAPSYTAAGSLTRTNDTNVTLTLGGSPTVSLLAATSLTLGWTGQLAASRGGTGLDTSGSTGVAQVAAGTWSISTALANGTTASNQSTGDNSNKVANTGYVDAQGGDQLTQAWQAMGSTIQAHCLAAPFINSNTALASGTLVIVAFYLKNPMTINGIKWWQVQKGSYTGTYGKAALCTSSGGTLTIQAISNNDNNMFQTASNGTMANEAFSSAYPASAGIYYAAFLYTSSASTTTPTIAIGPAQVTSSANLDFTNNNMLTGTKTGQTQIGSTGAVGGTITLSTVTPSTVNFWLSLY